MTTTSATTLADARALNRLVEAEGAKVPAVLVNVIAGFDALESQPPPDRPTTAILAAAIAGKLTPKKVDELIAEAVAHRARETFRAELHRDADALFIAAYDKALAEGAADKIIDAIRPEFDEAARVLTEARQIVDMGLSAQALLETAGPEQLAAYQSLAPAVATVNRLSKVVMHFGMRSIVFPQIERPALLDMAWVHDIALMCTEGDLRHASSVFREHIGNDPRSSPWMRVAPRLNSIGDVRERIRAIAENDWLQAQGPNGAGRVNPYTLAP